MRYHCLPLLLFFACLPAAAEDRIPIGLAENIITFLGQNHYLIGACDQLEEDEMAEEREAEKEEAMEIMEIEEAQFYRWHANGVKQAKRKWESATTHDREQLCIDLLGNVTMPEFR